MSKSAQGNSFGCFSLFMISVFGLIGFIIGFATEAWICFGEPNVFVYFYAGWQCDQKWAFLSISCLFLGAILGYITDKQDRQSGMSNKEKNR